MIRTITFYPKLTASGHINGFFEKNNKTRKDWMEQHEGLLMFHSMLEGRTHGFCDEPDASMLQGSLHKAIIYKINCSDLA